MKNYLQLGDIRLPLEDTFIGVGGYIHLPMPTFQRIIQDEKLEVTVETRDGDDGDYPFRYKAMLPNTPIGTISNSENLFD